MTAEEALRMKNAKEEIEKARDAVTNTLAFLNRQLSLGLPPLIRADFISEKARAERELSHLNLLLVHLIAGSVIIDPLTEEEAGRLDELAEVLDQAIKADFVINATLDLAMTVVDAAREIGDIIGDHA